MKVLKALKGMRRTRKTVAILVCGFITALVTALPDRSFPRPHQPDTFESFLRTRNPDAPALPEPDAFDAKLSKGKFLVASRRLGDPRFRETVVLLISYDRNGAAGLIINRPVKMSLSDAFPDSRIFQKRKDTVYFGGPVELNRLLFLIRSPGRPEESAEVFDGVYVSSSRNVLDRLIGKPRTGEHVRVYAGYAGWATGQLDAEIARGDWHVIQADARTIFEKKSDKIWPELIRRGSELQVWNSKQISAMPPQTNEA